MTPLILHTTQTVTLTNQVRTSTSLTQTVHLISTVPCHIQVAKEPTPTKQDFYIPANTPTLITPPDGQKIGAILHLQQSTPGVLYITGISK